MLYQVLLSLFYVTQQHPPIVHVAMSYIPVIWRNNLILHMFLHFLNAFLKVSRLENLITLI